MTYIETRTQEDISTDATCMWCNKQADGDGWFGCDGDIYCFSCAVKLDNMGDNEVHCLPTREQVATLAAWDAAGIGTD